MSSRWRPWDFLKHHPDVIDRDKKGLTVVYCTDPFIERMLRNKMSFKEWEGESALCLSGMELTLDWIEENLQTLSLFGTDRSICIVQGNSISASIKKYLLENSIADGSRHIVFFLNGDKNFFQNWQKKREGNFLEVEEPKFWELGKLLTYFADEMSMRIPMDVHQYLMQAVPHRSSEFVNILKTIRLSFGAGPYKVEQIKAIVPATRLDQFKLASLLGSRKLLEFYREIDTLNLSFKELIFFFKFAQGHLFKIMDPSYIAKKARPSKYDKEIEAHSKLWEREQLQLIIRQMSQLEIEAKKKSPHLKEKLRDCLLAEL